MKDNQEPGVQLVVCCVYIYIFFLFSPVDPDMFPRREVVKKEKSSEPSALAMLLAEHSKISANPFYKFSKFNGEVCWVV